MPDANSEAKSLIDDGSLGSPVAVFTWTLSTDTTSCCLFGWLAAKNPEARQHAGERRSLAGRLRLPDPAAVVQNHIQQGSMNFYELLVFHHRCLGGGCPERRATLPRERRGVPARGLKMPK
jgi:hypothetical protein